MLCGVVFTPNRRFLRSGWFWCGVAVTILITLPVIVWQIQHQFVAIAWMQSIHARDVSWGRTAHFIPKQFWTVTNPVAVPLWCAGLWFLFKSDAGKPFRILGWMYVVPFILFAIAKGRDYYLAPAYPMLIAAGAAWGESWVRTRPQQVQRSVMRSVRISLAIGALVTLSLTLPIAPLRSAWWRVDDATHGNFNMEVGWPELVATIAHVRDTLPNEDRQALGILAGDEGEAGAVNMYGHAYGLPEAISGMNSNWLRGYGNPPPQTVIAVGFSQSNLNKIFASCQAAARVPNPYGIVNSSVGDHAQIYVCRNIREPWPVFWKKFQYYG